MDKECNTALNTRKEVKKDKKNFESTNHSHLYYYLWSLIKASKWWKNKNECCGRLQQ